MWIIFAAFLIESLAFKSSCEFLWSECVVSIVFSFYDSKKHLAIIPCKVSLNELTHIAVHNGVRV